ncbi:hypothetical protein FACS18942_08730 [Planctomycetales bacterium]|nr:hypothetical protein FACS18942_08730 [Planctomycetales bacterium]GHT37580.1 hypothetical protein FACS189427_10700 [Planctomycetales bacterium]
MNNNNNQPFGISEQEYKILRYVHGILPVEEAETLKVQIESDKSVSEIYEKIKWIKEETDIKINEKNERKSSPEYQEYYRNLVSEMFSLHSGLLEPEQEEELRQAALDDDDYCDAYEEAADIFVAFREALRDRLREITATMKGEEPIAETSQKVYQSSSIKPQRHWQYATAIAVSACILLTMNVFYEHNIAINPDIAREGGTLADEEFNPLPSGGTWKKSQVAFRSSIINEKNHYKSKDEVSSIITIDRSIFDIQSLYFNVPNVESGKYKIGDKKELNTMGSGVTDEMLIHSFNYAVSLYKNKEKEYAEYKEKEGAECENKEYADAKKRFRQVFICADNRYQINKSPINLQAMGASLIGLTKISEKENKEIYNRLWTYFFLVQILDKQSSDYADALTGYEQTKKQLFIDDESIIKRMDMSVQESIQSKK